MCSAPTFLCKLKIVEGWPLFHSAPSHSFLCLEPGGAGDFGLCPVTSSPGTHASGLCLLSMVLKAETAPAAGGREQGPGEAKDRDGTGTGRHPLGRHLEERWAVIWEVWKREAVCKTTTAKFLFFFFKEQTQASLSNCIS